MGNLVLEGSFADLTKHKATDLELLCKDMPFLKILRFFTDSSVLEQEKVVFVNHSKANSEEVVASKSGRCCSFSVEKLIWGVCIFFLKRY